MAYKGMGQIDKKELWTIPNIITYFRILCIPAYIVLMAFAGLRADAVLLYVALGVFAVAAASDLVDGWIARRFNMTSGIGMALDPLADKLMHVSVLFCLSLCTGLTPLGEATEGLSVLGAATMQASGGWYVHYAFVILLLLKEAIMVCAAPLVMKKGAKVQANWMGKVASFTVSVGVILAFFHPYVAFADWGILAWGVCLSYGAAFGYLFDIIRQIRKINSGEMEKVTAESAKTTDSGNNPLAAKEEKRAAYAVEESAADVNKTKETEKTEE